MEPLPLDTTGAVAARPACGDGGVCDIHGGGAFLGRKGLPTIADGEAVPKCGDVFADYILRSNLCGTDGDNGRLVNIAAFALVGHRCGGLVSLRG